MKLTTFISATLYLAFMHTLFSHAQTGYSANATMSQDVTIAEACDSIPHQETDTVTNDSVPQEMTAARMFIEMPDSLLPYLKKNTREELIELKKIDKDASPSLSNTLESLIMLTRLSDDDNLLEVSIEDNITLEIGKLSDDLFVYIKTFATPEKESKCYIYNKLWELQKDLNLDYAQLVKSYEEVDTVTMTHDEYLSIQNLIEFPLVEAHIVDNPRTIVLQLNAPMLNMEEKERLGKILKVTRLVWNGTKFCKEM